MHNIRGDASILGLASLQHLLRNHFDYVFMALNSPHTRIGTEEEEEDGMRQPPSGDADHKSNLKPVRPPKSTYCCNGHIITLTR